MKGISTLAIKALNPLISVYMPTKNRLTLLPRAVQSVLQQNYQNLELIIVDDASTDATKEYLEELKKKDNRVRTIYLAESKGPSHARNLAIKEAKGEFVTGLDDDDEFLPERLSVFLSNWDKDYTFITSSLLWDYGNTRKLLGGKSIDIKLDDLLSHKHECCHVFTRTSHIIAAGLFDETMTNSEDWDLWIRLGLTRKPIKQIKEATYVIHTAHESPRLSVDGRKAEGLRVLISKYQQQMSSKNKKDMAIRLTIMERRCLPLAKLVPLLTRDNVWLYTKFWAREKLPILTKIVRNLIKRSA